MRTALRALLATVVLAVLTGLLYPLVMTGVGQVAFRHQANGSLVTVGDRTVGSSLIGQGWKGPGWFYGRPSAVNDSPTYSSGSNLGPTSAELAKEIRLRAAAIMKLEGLYQPGLTTAKIPVDLLTASASGLDPDISPAAAQFQAPRIAAVRQLPLASVQELIRAHTQGRTFGVLGEPRVNVLELNLALRQAVGVAVIALAEPGRHVVILGRRVTQVDIDRVAELACADGAHLVILSVGWPVTPAQQAIVSRALELAADLRVPLEAEVVASHEAAQALVSADDEVIVAGDERIRRRFRILDRGRR